MTQLNGINRKQQWKLKNSKVHDPHLQFIGWQEQSRLVATLEAERRKCDIRLRSYAYVHRRFVRAFLYLDVIVIDKLHSESKEVYFFSTISTREGNVVWKSKLSSYLHSDPIFLKNEEPIHIVSSYRNGVRPCVKAKPNPGNHESFDLLVVLRLTQQKSTKENSCEVTENLKKPDNYSAIETTVIRTVSAKLTLKKVSM